MRATEEGSLLQAGQSDPPKDMIQGDKELPPPDSQTLCYYLDQSVSNGCCRFGVVMLKTIKCSCQISVGAV